MARIDSEHALRQALSQQTSDQPPYLVQECALEAREFEIYLIQSAESPEQYATLSITEVLNNSGDTLPVNGIKNSATSYVDITESFSPEQLDILWSYLKTIGAFRTARYGIRANDIEALLAGDFKVFEINLFLPMPLVLLCQNVSHWRQVQLINRLTAELARVTGTIPKRQKKKSIFFRKLFAGKFIRRLSEEEVVDLKTLKKIIYGFINSKLLTGCTNFNSLEVRKSCRSKKQARDAFAKHDVPHAKGRTFINPWKAHQFAKEQGFPLVVKPNVGGFSRGSYFPIRNYRELWKAALLAKIWWPTSVIEQYLEGKNYRVLVANGRVVSVIQRYAPFVTGNGVDTIASLIDAENIIREQMGLLDCMYPLQKSSQTRKMLSKQNLTLDLCA